MKFLIAFVALFALALAAPAVEIVRLSSDVQPDHYSYDVETSDGTVKHEEGSLLALDNPEGTLVVHGSFSYKDEKTGQVYTVNYVADENGFQPSGAHLPSPVPIPNH